jgi:hypothetical protein
MAKGNKNDIQYKKKGWSTASRNFEDFDHIEVTM